MPLVGKNCLNTKGGSADAVACCPVCCEEKPFPAIRALSVCHHHSCTACLVQWIEKTEATGQTDPPGCPFCRLPITGDDVTEILGRPYQPKQATLHPTDTSAIDDLTLQWLQEQTKPCPSCGVLIEKTEGCDLMECLCGFRFCYKCGVPGRGCDCTPADHFFWDNINRHSAGRTATCAVAIVDQETGYVNLRNHIQLRKALGHADMYRRQCAYQRTREASARRRQWNRELVGPRKNQAVIDQASLTRREARATRRKERESHQSKAWDEAVMSAKWLFCSSKHKFQVLEQLTSRGKIQLDRSVSSSRLLNAGFEDEALFASRWLFSAKNGNESKVIGELLARPIVQKERKARKKTIGKERKCVDRFTLSARWIVCSQSRNAAMRVLRQQEQGSMTAQKRKLWQDQVRKELAAVDKTVLNADWLFLPAHAVSGVLEKKFSKSATQKRSSRLALKKKRMRKPTKAEILAASGEWLFIGSNYSSKMMLRRLFRDQLSRLSPSQLLKFKPSQLTVKQRLRRVKIANRRGRCAGCGVKTHAVSAFHDQRTPLTNDKVQDGICIRCGSEPEP